MESRQEQLLKLVIENYIATAEPVGSKFLVSAAGLDWSEATVRNELRELEEKGYLTHPHTSAGRIPTPHGYRYYIDHLDLVNAKIDKSEEQQLDRVSRGERDREALLKNVAKTLAALSSEMVLLAFSADKIYYTGLANLFQKPDFGDMQLAISVSQVFDQCEEYVPELYEMVGHEPRFLIGDEHPFGSMLSLLSMRFGKRDESLLALIGPLRMNYRYNWGLASKVRELI